MIEKYPIAMESFLEILENDERLMEAIVLIFILVNFFFEELEKKDPVKYKIKEIRLTENGSYEEVNP